MMIHTERIDFDLILQFEWPNDMVENTFAVFLKMKNLPFLVNINDPKVYINNSGLLVIS